jgi:hypothetical protein
MKDDIQLLKNDIEAQINALNHRDDVDWSCYEVGNWQCLLDAIIRIETAIKEMT